MATVATIYNNWRNVIDARRLVTATTAPTILASAPVLRQLTPAVLPGVPPTPGARTSDGNAVTAAQQNSPTAPLPGTVSHASFNASTNSPVQETAVDPMKQAENRAQLIKVVVGSALLWFAFGYLQKGR